MKNHYKNNTFHVNYVIYEKNDTAILLDGVVTKNHKQYFTAIPIDPVNFSYLCEKAIGFEKITHVEESSNNENCVNLDEKFLPLF